MPNFVQKALVGEDLTLYGDGQQIRSFTHVEDAISAVVKLAQTPKAHGEVFNVGNTESATIEELAHKVIGLTESSSKIKKVSYEEVFGKDFEDIRARVPSLEKLRSQAEGRNRLSKQRMSQRAKATEKPARKTKAIIMAIPEANSFLPKTEART